jgi:Holliday junction resolvase RusA-like endonuclease
MTIYGPPRTKKNHSRVVRAGRFTKVLPSEAYERWESIAVPQMRIAWAGRIAISYPINVRATFYRDANRGDAVGYYQALADALEVAGVIADDKFIVSWDGTRMAVDRKRPRVEVEIEAVEEL